MLETLVNQADNVEIAVMCELYAFQATIQVLFISYPTPPQTTSITSNIPVYPDV